MSEDPPDEKQDSTRSIDEFLGSLASAASSGQALDAGAIVEGGQLEVITGLTEAIDEATELSEAFKLENDL